MDNVLRRSREVLCQAQVDTGAIFACQSFGPYRDYCWTRDGAFCAHALDLLDETDRAERFFSWCADTIGRYSNELAADRSSILDPRQEWYLPARFRSDGSLGNDKWPAFQLDGHGTLLHFYSEHLRRTNSVPSAQWRRVGPALAGYLADVWRSPCFDCWEEGGEHLHFSTLCAVRAGLIAARAVFEVSDDGITQAVADIEKVLINATSQRGYVPKSLHAKTLEPIADVDASAYWTASPFGFFPADSAVMWATDHEIGNQGLVSGTGGVHRHNSTPYREGIPLVGERGDGYYGGGLWVSLTAARGVWLAGAGQTAQAELCLQWILAHAQPNGDLAEQISDDLLRPGDYEYWRQHWGAPASPLTWAHAEFVRLAAALDQLA